jgi:hypothetical protein
MLQKRYNKVQHNMAHAPDAFSSLCSCEGAGDAVVILFDTDERALNENIF